MADESDLYPPGPSHVSAALTTPTRDYRARVLVVLCSLLLFVTLYVGLVIGSAYLCYYSFTSHEKPAASAGARTRAPVYRPPPRERDFKGAWVIVGICSGFLCLFLVKGLFKWQKSDASLRVEVGKKDQPRLFDFIHRVCRDTKAPKPHRVFLTPEVNAAVFYHTSFLSLFLPTPKNLLIGLGLVNRLNLSEFKAVLAHEFGHFSQNSMKLGAYVYTSNRIVGDIVFGRDWLDGVVHALRRTDIRIAVFAWAFTGVLWALRKILERLFRTINFANFALMRQMEFNADLVAVSVSGSDALVNGLSRLDFANESLVRACQELSTAADHKLYSNDMFFHQSRAAEHLRVLQKNPRLGEPPEVLESDGKPVYVFEPGDDGVPLMWATHPSNHDRERNAKRHYLRCPIDSRSPWLLFDDVAAVRERVTRRHYEVNHGLEDVALIAAEKVQEFIDEEHAETTYDPRYQGMYDDRYLNPGVLDVLMSAAPTEPAAVHQLLAEHIKNCGESLKERMESFQQHRNEYTLLAGLVNGSLDLAGDHFTFREVQYGKGDFETLFKQVNGELDADMEWLAGLDRQSFTLHLAIARQLGDGKAEELVARYQFHLAVQNMLQSLAGAQQHVHNVLSPIQGRELSAEDYKWVRREMKNVHAAVLQNLLDAEKLRIPELKNISAGPSLGKFLLPSEFVTELGKRKLDGEWVGKLISQLQEILSRTHRIYAKSLGGLLAFQEQLANLWTSRAPILEPQRSAESVT